MFIHLRVESDYSLLKSANKVKKLVDIAVQNNMQALAITDNNLFGALEFAEYASANGVQPIIGCDLCIKYFNISANVILIAKTEIGYKNLITLSMLSSRRELELNDVFQYREDLILLSGDIIILCIKNNLDRDHLITQIRNNFLSDFYIEISRVENNQFESYLVEIAYKYDIPLVATNNVLYPTPDYKESYQILTCISDGMYLDSPDKDIVSSQCYFKSTEDMIELFSDISEAIENTIVIARKCRFMPEVRSAILPRFLCNDEDSELEKQSFAGLKKRLNSENLPGEYLKRLEYELGVIIKMKYSGYFLIVSDFINWSKAHGIPVGPGRGSGVGSVVAWSLNITGLDPIKFGLLFERFLNPVRVSMPDFDIDFCQEKRHLVIDYIKEKYGHIAQIVTFGSLQPRAALRDVGRVLQIPYGRIDKICKMIPHNPANPISLTEAIAIDHNLQKERDGDEVIKKLLGISLKLEGLYRHASTHAAGIVISDKPITDYVPVYYEDGSDVPITQYSMKYVEKAGLIKFDFLGLKTLTAIHKACELIKNHHTEFDIDAISLEDEKTFQLLSSGKSIGVFQLENPFMCEALQKLKPDSIDDIIALVSLNRPGPMSNIPIYIDRKHGREKVQYPHHLLENVLSETFGIVIYQEQVMEVARILAGYTLAEADILRRAMGKKIRSEMALQKKKFVSGAIENNLSQSKAEEIFDMVEKFAGYGFNKSHAAAYAIISYQTAYLKANFPLEFFTAMLNLEINNTDKVAVFINDAKLCGIEITPPDINESSAYFKIKGDGIRYSLAALKNVGEGAAAFLTNCGKFSNIGEIANKSESKFINKRLLESLIKSGALDSIYDNRAALMLSVENILSHKKDINQMSLFEESTDDLIEKNIKPWNFLIQTKNEFEAIGFFLDNHPLSLYADLLRVPPSKLAGVITQLRIRSRGNRKFAVLQLSTVNNIYTIIFYESEIIERKIDLFAVGSEVVMDINKGDNGITGKDITKLQDFILKNLGNKILIKINKESQIHSLKRILRSEGRFNILLLAQDENTTIKIALPGNYSFSLDELLLIPGIKCFKQ